MTVAVPGASRFGHHQRSSLTQSSSRGGKRMPTLQFLGAAGSVTGSRYLIEAGGERLLVDCGLFQGEKELRLRNWNPFPAPPASINCLVLTHAHLDHTGYIPRLIKEGFRGQVLATSATVDICQLLLPDSGHLQEEDAAYANKQGFSKHKPALPLYTYDDAVKSLQSFRAVDESKPVEISEHFSCRFFAAGHILGARMIELTVHENGVERRVLFSGDLGRERQLLIRGTVVIPAFAVGRTQELLYVFRELVEQNKVHSIPIHVDSPMAIDSTDLYNRHHEDHNLDVDALEKQGVKPFAPPGVHFDRTVEESKAINDVHFPMVIISASGMATGGRVLHHLKRCLPDHRNTILFEGFQAAGTRGRIIQSGATSVKIHGAQVSIRARVESMDNLSGHADYGEILRWLGRFPKAPQKVHLVHGEPAASQSLREKFTNQLHWETAVAAYLQKIVL